MSRPTKFEVMRLNRRLWSVNNVERMARLQEQINGIEDEMAAEWRAQPREPISRGYDSALTQRPPRRWWWPATFVAQARQG